MTAELAKSLQKKNLQKLKRILSEKNYEEIYVNVGRKYLKSIQGFEKFTSAQITYARGVLGQKATHMKQWLQERTPKKGPHHGSSGQSRKEPDELDF